MTQPISMSDLFQKLDQLGFTEKYIRDYGLPSWWADELNNKYLAVLEGASYISDNLNIDFRSLISAEETIKFKTQVK